MMKEKVLMMLLEFTVLMYMFLKDLSEIENLGRNR